MVKQKFLQVLNFQAMTWAMHTIGFLDLGDVNKAAEMFDKSYSNYVREPFKVSA